MIPRYTRKIMANIWQDSNKFRIWFLIEAHICDILSQKGIIPSNIARAMWTYGDKPYTEERIMRITEIEQDVRHDVIAFLTELSEQVGQDTRFIHQGVTSSDILDTCYAVQCTQAIDLLCVDIDALLQVCQQKAITYKHTVCIGRSHGIHAEPTTLGLKFATFYAEFTRNKKRLQQAREEIATCAISGAVGTFAHIEPFVESYVAEKFGLTPEPISTQIIPRDRHAVFFATLAIIASSIERLAIEIRHLQRTEVREVEEYFTHNQKGSSAMPHKRNPILSENLTGLSRLVRSMIIPALENVAVWHERDISHSSVERIIGPNATIILDFALDRLTHIVDQLIVHPEAIAANLNLLSGLVHSQKVLLALTSAGMNREDAYQVVQRNAMLALDTKSSFIDLLKNDCEIRKYLSDKNIDSIFDLSLYTRHVETILKRVFK